MLVTTKNLNEVLESLSYETFLALDTETTGLHPHQGDRLFSMILAGSKGKAWYFNFIPYENIDSELVLPRSVLEKMQFLFGNPTRTWFMHNAKFDLGILHQDGVEIAGKVHCTMAVGRVCQNNRLSYSLDSLAEIIGMKKDDVVKSYIVKHKLYEWRTVPGKTKRFKHPFYDKVPFELITEYGLQDGRVTYNLGIWQREFLKQKSGPGIKDILEVMKNEISLTKTCFEMEKRGIRINRAYVLEAAEHEDHNAEKAVAEFQELSGMEFKDSNKILEIAFRAAGEKITYTAPSKTFPKGQPSFTDDILEEMTTPLATVLREYRAASKRSQTYYRNFLHFADKDGIIHADIRQSGTDNGRMSYSAPNLQNLPKEEDQSQRYIVRRSFIPRENFCLVPIDYRQMEYRLMLDYAGETGLIRKIKEGLDVHDATAQLMGVTRGEAKTLNFMLLYGGGAGKLAASLGISLREAEELRGVYFSALPQVSSFIKEVVRRAKAGPITNWMGRVYTFDFEYAYIAPNYLIAGGCADVVKLAMNCVGEFLRPYKSKMLVQVHDELLFEIHKDEFHIIDTLRLIMESAYIPKMLPLACDIDHSWVSWGDKVKGLPGEREQLQKEGGKRLQGPAQFAHH